MYLPRWASDIAHDILVGHFFIAQADRNITAALSLDFCSSGHLQLFDDRITAVVLLLLYNVKQLEK